MWSSDEGQATAPGGNSRPGIGAQGRAASPLWGQQHISSTSGLPGGAPRLLVQGDPRSGETWDVGSAMGRGNAGPGGNCPAGRGGGTKPQLPKVEF